MMTNCLLVSLSHDTGQQRFLIKPYNLMSTSKSVKPFNNAERCLSIWSIMILPGTQKFYPRVDKDLLIFAASFKRSPSAPELFCLIKVNLLSILQAEILNIRILELQKQPL